MPAAGRSACEFATMLDPTRSPEGAALEAFFAAEASSHPPPENWLKTEHVTRRI